MIRSLAALVGLLLAAPALASPAGLWEIESRDSRYQVSLCGDGTQLCARLVWLGNGADSPQNLPYLNTMLIDGARPTGPGQWQGDLHLYGQTAGGTITQVNAQEMTLRGCVALVICKTYRMFRIGD